MKPRVRVSRERVVRCSCGWWSVATDKDEAKYERDVHAKSHEIILEEFWNE